MKVNVGSIDRIFRVLVAIIIAVLYFTHQVSGAAAIILLAIAGIFILTGFVGVCPLYLALGVSTRKKEKSVK